MGKALDTLGSAGCAAVFRSLFQVLREDGNRLIAPCPFHSEQTPGAFGYTPDTDDAWCHACQTKGDLVGVFNVLTGRSQDDSNGFKDFFERFAPGQDIVFTTMKRTQPTRTKGFQPGDRDLPRGKWITQANKYVSRCHEILLRTPRVLGWLEKERGLTLETVKRFRLGFNPEDMYRHRETWGLPQEYWPDNGKPKRLKLRAALIIPAFDDDGNVMRIQTRLLPWMPEGPKYLPVKGGRNWNYLIGKDRLVYVDEETELDGMLIAQEAGDLVGVCVNLAVSIKPKRDIHDHLNRARLILGALDAGEKPGAQESVKWAAMYPETFRRHPVPFGKDPGEYWKMGGNIRKWIMAGIPPGLLEVIELRSARRASEEHFAAVQTVDKDAAVVGKKKKSTSAPPKEETADQKFGRVTTALKESGHQADADSLARFRELFRTEYPIELCRDQSGGKWIQVDQGWADRNRRLAQEVSACGWQVMWVLERFWPELFTEVQVQV